MSGESGSIARRLRSRSGTRWVHAGAVRGARSRRARAAEVAGAAGGVSAERAAETIEAARLQCADRLGTVARAGGWGNDTRIEYAEEWAEYDAFRVRGVTDFSDAGVWTRMCHEFAVMPGDDARMTLRVMPASRSARGSPPTILIAHALVDAAAVRLLSGDTATLRRLRARLRREHTYAWLGLLLYALVLVGALVAFLYAFDLRPVTAVIVAVERALAWMRALWRAFRAVSWALG
jgi:hypothetical protein